MSKSNNASPDAFGSGDDLSLEVAAAMAKAPAEIVRCRKVAPHRYRVNWWCAEGTGEYDNPGMKGGQLATTHRIRKSEYLEATKTQEGLQIRVISSSGA